MVVTGAVPFRPPLELAGEPVVLDAWDVLGGAAVPAGHVVVAASRASPPWCGRRAVPSDALLVELEAAVAI